MAGYFVLSTKIAATMLLLMTTNFLFMVELDEKDILQASATIIAGVLILLAFASTVTNELKAAAKLVVGVAILPFIIAAFMLFVKAKHGNESRTRISRATYAFVAGLAYLMVAVIVLLVSS